MGVGGPPNIKLRKTEDASIPAARGFPAACYQHGRQMGLGLRTSGLGFSIVLCGHRGVSSIEKMINIYNMI